jgi:hypothetical protein
MSISPRPTSSSIVVNRYPIEELFEDFWSTYGDPITLVRGGFAAGLSALLIDRLTDPSIDGKN